MPVSRRSKHGSPGLSGIRLPAFAVWCGYTRALHTTGAENISLREYFLTWSASYRSISALSARHRRHEICSLCHWCPVVAHGWVLFWLTRRGITADVRPFDTMVEYIDNYTRITAEAKSRDEAMLRMIALYPDYAEADFFLQYSIDNHVTEHRNSE